jgi:hypothetical protein
MPCALPRNTANSATTRSTDEEDAILSLELVVVCAAVMDYAMVYMVFIGHKRENDGGQAGDVGGSLRGWP